MRFHFLIVLIYLMLLFPTAVYSQLNEDQKGQQTQSELACDDNTWAIIKKSKNVDAYNKFLTECPDSRWVVLARHLMKSLVQDQAQQIQKKVSLSTKHDVDW